MDRRQPRGLVFATLLLQIQLAISSSIVVERQDSVLSPFINGTSIVNSLQYTSNCTAASLWYNNLPADGTAGQGNNSINIAFLRASLPLEYQNATDSQVATFYDDMSSGLLSTTDWLATAWDDVETSCIAPQFEKKVTLAQLNATQNCTETAIFLSSLGWISSPHNYTNASVNDTQWPSFLFYALPASIQENITDVELFVYTDHILSSESDTNINNFLQNAYSNCHPQICEVQGYTGNPDIGGIGVLISYTLEAAIVTLYFIAVNVENYLFGIRPPPERVPSRVSKAFHRASVELLDGALFFSFSISSAGWISFHSGRSYYEKLVFTSANILALSALLAFLAMFPSKGLEKRGYLLVVMVVGILVESGIQYVVYLTENNNAKYDDYMCLRDKFNTEGYHPAVFEALFFLLVGLTVVGGAIALWYKIRHKQEIREREALNEDLNLVERWAFAARIFVEVVAICVVWVECIYMYKLRAIMSQVAGASWSEGNWGFGQILALFVWFPILLSISGTLLLPKWFTGTEEHKPEIVGGDKDAKIGARLVDEKLVPVTCVPLDSPVLKQRATT